MLNARCLMARRRSSDPSADLRSMTYRKDVPSGGLIVTEEVSVSIGAVNVTSDSDGITSEDYAWLQNGAASDFQIRADLVSGTVSSGSSAIGTWLSPTGQTWKKSKTAKSGSSTVQLTLRLRRASDFVEIDAATVSLTVNIEL